MKPRSPLYPLAAACLFALAAAACSRAPAEPIADPVPPPRRPYDAKTQLEYGDPRPPVPPQRY
ncbi:hypothetical protein [Methylobacterium gnaphalii]|uniref:hypothetical protein n=1 Tax=Methylobacterium gnaphalii TaxID=1010610 RepID=UPI0011BF3DC1|nr:hypothetical protein [Methylobacterium gnaphalii]